MARLSLPFGRTPLSAVAFTGDGRLLVSTWDPRGRFGLVDAASGRLLADHAVAGSWS